MLRVHDPKYVALLLAAGGEGEGGAATEAAAEAQEALAAMASSGGEHRDVYVTCHTVAAARACAGAAIGLALALWSGGGTSAGPATSGSASAAPAALAAAAGAATGAAATTLAASPMPPRPPQASAGGAGLSAAVLVSRPPGHHAGRASVGGGCFLNNAALAASAARAAGCPRVLILDFDVHHGNGTQEIFYTDGNVLTVSLHAFEQAPGRFYPCAGLSAHTGIGAGAGCNVNIAFPHASGGFGDADYGAVFAHLVLPIVAAFDPALLLVAAGFDSGRGDPIGGFDLTAAGFAAMVRGLRGASRPGTKLLMVPEGGYNVEAQALALDACVAALRRGEDTAGVSAGLAKPETAIALAVASRHLAAYWPCLRGWEGTTVAGTQLGDVPAVPRLECTHHAPCWCAAR